MKVSKHETETIKDDVWIKSTCLMCYNNCSIRVHRVNGVVIKIEGDPDAPQNAEKICAKGLAGIMSLYSPSRVKSPLKRTNPEKGIGVDPKWVEISWDEALDIATERLKKVREDDPRKLIVMSFDRVNVSSFRTYVSWGTAFGTPGTHLVGSATYF